MASKKTQKKTSKKSASASKTRSSVKSESVKGVKLNNNARTGEDDNLITSEIAIVASFLFALLLFLSNFRINGISIIGSFGEILRKVQLGIFGWMGYIFPILLFIVTIFVLANRDNPKITIKLIALFLATISLAGLLHCLIGNTDGDFSLVKDAFKLTEGGYPQGGGFIGAVFSLALVTVIGKTGAILVMLAILIVSIVAITEKSFVNAVKKKSDKAYTSVKDDVRVRRKEAQLRHDRELLSRADRKIEGVDLASTNLSVNTAADIRESEAIANGLAELDLKDNDTYSTVTDDFKETDPNVFKGNIRKPFYDSDTVPFDEDSSVTRSDDTDVTTATPLSEAEQEKASIIERKTVKPVAKPTAAEKASADEEVKKEISAKNAKPAKPYKIPPMNLLQKGIKGKFNDKEYKDTAVKLQQTLSMFGVNVTVEEISVGPTVTRYELHPEMGVKVSSVLNLQDDLKLALAAADVRIEAPIPGKAAIGIEVPNKENNAVMLRDILDSPEYKNTKAKVPFAVGKDIAGDIVLADIAKMPHVLIAGATGSGKSVCINTIILSIIYKYSPEEVKMIMVDPKVVELSVYNGIPHLMIPVVNDPKKASGALNWAVQEMMTRYRMFEEAGTKDIAGFNTKNPDNKMPYIVIIIDELADLMMVAKSEVEDAICRIAQLARAAGIHLVIATQRPSVDVITGLIKANIPSRIAFAVSSGVDSKTIIDGVGAEKLLGKGDMLYKPQDVNKPLRIQGAFVSEREINDVVDYIKAEGLDSNYDEATISKIAAAAAGSAEPGMASDRDELFIQAAKYIIDKDKASIGNLQRAFRIGFNRAARIMDQLCDAGVVGPEQGTKPREVLMSEEQFENMLEQEG